MKEKRDSWGYEYKSKTTIRGIPLLHISFKYRPNLMPVPAKGIISIGQVGIGVINISQFGLGIISISQIAIAAFALAQIAVAYALIAQVGLYIHKGYGQIVWNIADLANYAYVACTFDPSDGYTYRSPDKINDGLDVGSLDDAGIDAGRIEEAVNRIRLGLDREVHSMLIFTSGKLVLEEYFEGHRYKWGVPKHHGESVTWDRTTPHDNMSVTKSITSACIGIAIDHGFIESVHQSIFEYLPEHRHLGIDGKEKITIEHLLTMTAGLQWREWSAPYSSKRNPCIGIWFQDKDPVTYILEKPMTDAPGTSFNYSSGNTVLMGRIIENATMMSIDDFSNNYLFEPLGIDSADWALKYKNGVDANNIKLTPRAMMKIGVTFLNKGLWKGDRIVSEEWVEKSAAPFPGNDGINVPDEDSGENGYSYTWWTKEHSESGKNIHMYSAGGFGGQHIMIIPELSTVVVFTGGNYVTKRPPFEILEKYILPAFH